MKRNKSIIEFPKWKFSHEWVCSLTDDELLKYVFIYKDMIGCIGSYLHDDRLKEDDILLILREDNSKTKFKYEPIKEWYFSEERTREGIQTLINTYHNNEEQKNKLNELLKKFNNNLPNFELITVIQFIKEIIYVNNEIMNIINCGRIN